MGISREELLKQTEGMSAQELTELGDALHALANRNNGIPRRRIIELEALGKEAWEGVDVVEYLEHQGGNRAKFLSTMSKVPDIEPPDERDRI